MEKLDLMAWEETKNGLEETAKWMDEIIERILKCRETKKPLDSDRLVAELHGLKFHLFYPKSISEWMTRGVNPWNAICKKHNKKITKSEEYKEFTCTSCVMEVVDTFFDKKEQGIIDDSVWKIDEESLWVSADFGGL